MSSLDQDDDLEDQTLNETEENHGNEVESSSSFGLRAWTIRASNYVVSKMSILDHFGDNNSLLQAPAPPERTESSNLDPNNDEEGTTSGGTSGDDIWGTPTSGGPDDESFNGSSVRFILRDYSINFKIVPQNYSMIMNKRFFYKFCAFTSMCL